MRIINCILLSVILAPCAYGVAEDKREVALRSPCIFQATTTLVGYKPDKFTFEDAFFFDAAWKEAFKLAHINDKENRVGIAEVTIEEETSYHATRPGHSFNHNGKRNLRQLKGDEPNDSIDVLLNVRVLSGDEVGRCDEINWPAEDGERRRGLRQEDSSRRNLAKIRRNGGDRKFDVLLCGILKSGPQENFNTVEGCSVAYLPFLKSSNYTSTGNSTNSTGN